MDDVSTLTQLGSKQTDYKVSGANAGILETFPNRFPHRDYVIDLVFPEFTSVCPKTGQPDFATIRVSYIPKERCVETKSLKLYFFAYRNDGAFMESITNTILEDLVAVCSPKWMRVVGEFNSRGGVALTTTAEHVEK